MGARLEHIARMKPDDRFGSVASWIEALADTSGIKRPVVNVTFRRFRMAGTETLPLIIVGVAHNDNGTSSGELIIQNMPHRLYGISLAHVEALEAIDPRTPAATR